MKNNTKKLRRLMRKVREDALAWANRQNLETVISAERSAKWRLRKAVSHVALLRQIMNRCEPGTSTYRSKALALAKERKCAAGLAGEYVAYRAVSCARVQGMIE